MYFLIPNGFCVTSMPLIVAVPDVGSIKLRNRLIVVVLSAPIGAEQTAHLAGLNRK